MTEPTTVYDLCFGSPKSGAPSVLLTGTDEDELLAIADQVNRADLYQAEGLRAFVRERVLQRPRLVLVEDIGEDEAPAEL